MYHHGHCLPLRPTLKKIDTRDKRRIIGFDVEKVQLWNKQNIAASIAIVFAENEIVYEALVLIDPSVIRCTVSSVSGLRSKRAFLNGKNVETIREIVPFFISDTIITCSGFNDLLSLGFSADPIRDQPYIDLRDLAVDENDQPVSLRRINLTLFNEDIKKAEHSSRTDALATAKAYQKYLDDGRNWSKDDWIMPTMRKMVPETCSYRSRS